MSVRKPVLVAYVHMYPPLHLAGAELMLHSILRWLVARGWECRVCVIGGRGYRYGIGGDYELDGVRVSEDEVATLTGADVIITHLDRTRESMSIAQYLGVPLVHLVHNHLTLKRNNVDAAELVVFNSEWLAEAVAWTGPTAVLHPPVWADDYRVKPDGDAITLVNLQVDKGVRVFYALARRYPEHRFIGVRGAYGVQVEESLPNLEIVGPVVDMRDVYRETRILLMPSTYESYGRVAIEAACSGIPTIAAPTPGLREALGDAAVYAEARDNAAWATALEQVDRDWADWSTRARARADSLDPEAELTVLESALRALVS